MSKALVKWIDGMNFVGIDADGRGTLISGGEGPGISPMQMLLLGLGSCASIDIVLILKKQHQAIEDIQVEVEGQRAANPPRPYENIHLHFLIKGTDLDSHKVERAIQLSTEKYCGVHATLMGVANITWDFEVTDPKQPEGHSSASLSAL